MKRLLFLLFVLMLLFFGGMIALLRSVDVQTVQQKAVSQLGAFIGRDVKISGEIGFRYWPSLSLVLNQVTIGNAPWGKAPYMVEVGAVDVALELMPLLSRNIVVKHFTLKDTKVFLETSLQGQGNWVLELQKPKETLPKNPSNNQSEARTAGTMPTADDFKLTMGDIKIQNADVSYFDHKSKKTYALSKLDVNLLVPEQLKLWSLDGQFLYNDKTVQFSFANKQATDKKTIDQSIAFEVADLFRASFDGAVNKGDSLLKGDITFFGDDLAGIQSWLTKTSVSPASINSAAVQKGQLHLTKTAADIKNIELVLGDIFQKPATGDLSISFQDKPFIKANLQTSKINFDDLTKQNEKSAGAENAKAAGVWDQSPLPFKSLQTVDADITVKAEGFTIKATEIGATTLSIKLMNGALRFDHTPATMLGGVVTSDLRADSQGTVGLEVKVDGVDAEPLLTNFMNFKKLSGKLDATLSVAGRGLSQQQIISSLSGQGRVQFQNGSLKGMDVINLAQRLQSGLDQAGVGEGKTDFLDLTASYTIRKGIVENNDLKMKGPLLQLTGAGTVDLPKRFVDYKITPVLTASSAADKVKGFEIPMFVRGPFHDIKVRADFKSIISDTLANPEKLKENLQNLKEGAKKIEDKFDPLKDSLKEIKSGDKQQGVGGLLEGLGVVPKGSLTTEKPAVAPVAPAPEVATPSVTAAPQTSPAPPAPAAQPSANPTPNVAEPVAPDNQAPPLAPAPSVSPDTEGTPSALPTEMTEPSPTEGDASQESPSPQ